MTKSSWNVRAVVVVCLHTTFATLITISRLSSRRRRFDYQKKKRWVVVGVPARKRDKWIELSGRIFSGKQVQICTWNMFSMMQNTRLEQTNLHQFDTMLRGECIDGAKSFLRKVLKRIGSSCLTDLFNQFNVRRGDKL